MIDTGNTRQSQCGDRPSILRGLIRFATETFLMGAIVGTLEYSVVLTFRLRQPLLSEESAFSVANLLLAAIAYGLVFALGCAALMVSLAALNGLCKRTIKIAILPQTGVYRTGSTAATAFYVFLLLATHFDWGEWNIMILTNLLVPFGHIYSGFLPATILKFLVIVGVLSLLLRVNVERKFLLCAGVLALATSAVMPFLGATEHPKWRHQSQGGPKKPNVIILVSDALRADHLSAYGNSRVKTPAISRLAQEGTIFSNAFSQAPVTGPSLASLFTSQYPLHHGATKYLAAPAESSTTLTEMLQAEGYATAAIISNMAVDYRTLGKGFEHYDDLFFSPAGRNLHVRLNGLTLSRLLKRSDIGTLGHYHPERSGDRTADLAIAFVETTRQPFFLFLHFMEPHSPYESGEPYNSMYDPNMYDPILLDSPNADLIDQLSWKVPEPIRNSPHFAPAEKRILPKDIRRIIAMYDGSITFMDLQVGRVLETLRKTGRLDHTLIVFTSDHGECLFEHNLHMEHNRYLYDSTLHIPLILRYPAAIPQGLVVQDVVESVDIMPTILELCGIEAQDAFDGRSLVPFFRGAEPEGFDHAFGIVGTHPRKLMYSVRSFEYKYIFRPHNASRELYYLPEDRHEGNNLAASRPEVAGAYHALLEAWLRRWSEPIAVESPRLTPSEIEKLKALGYVE